MGYLELKYKEVVFNKEIADLLQQIENGDDDKSVKERLDLARSLQAENHEKIKRYEEKFQPEGK